MHVQPSLEARSDLYGMDSLSGVHTILTTGETAGERAGNGVPRNFFRGGGFNKFS